MDPKLVALDSVFEFALRLLKSRLLDSCTYILLQKLPQCTVCLARTLGTLGESLRSIGNSRHHWKELVPLHFHDNSTNIYYLKGLALFSRRELSKGPKSCGRTEIFTNGDSQELIWRERRDINLETLRKGNSDECNLHGTWTYILSPILVLGHEHGVSR